RGRAHSSARRSLGLIVGRDIHDRGIVSEVRDLDDLLSVDNAEFPRDGDVEPFSEMLVERPDGVLVRDEDVVSGSENLAFALHEQVFLGLEVKAAELVPGRRLPGFDLPDDLAYKDRLVDALEIYVAHERWLLMMFVNIISTIDFLQSNS